MSRRLVLSLGLLGLLILAGFWLVPNLLGYYHFRASRDSLAHGDLGDARRHVDSGLKWRPSDADAQLLAARICRKAGAMAEADRHLDACDSLQGDKTALTLERALLDAQRGNLNADVEGLLWSYIKLDHPDTVSILEALAEGYRWTYRVPQAMDCTNRWLERQPDDSRALLLRGWLWRRMNRHEKAYEDYRRALELAPDSDLARARLAQLMVEEHLGSVEEAAAHFEHLRQREPDNPGVLLGLARCRRALNHVEEAERLLEQILAANPGNVQALVERAKLLLEARQPALAEKPLRQAAVLSPHDRDVNFTLAQCCRQLGKEQEMRTYLANVERIDVDLQRLQDLIKATALDRGHDPKPRYEMGTLLMRIDLEEEGRRWLEMALQQDPGHRPSHEALADYFDRKGDHVLADRHRRLAVSTP